jgi:hypothetical protein
VRWEKLAGTLFGIGILFSIFLLPTSSLTNSQTNAPDSVYTILVFFIVNFGPIQSIPFGSLVEIAYLCIASSVLMIASGVLGLRPRIAGVLGVLGVVLLWVAGTLSPNYASSAIQYGMGLYAIIILSLAQLVVSFSKFLPMSFLRSKIQKEANPQQVPQVTNGSEPALLEPLVRINEDDIGPFTVQGLTFLWTFQYSF